MGASGALYGLLGVLFSDLIQNWRFLEKPRKNLLTMLLVLTVSLGMGLLPNVDNFAHLGGFIAGLLSVRRRWHCGVTNLPCVCVCAQGMVFLPTFNLGILAKFVKFFSLPLLVALFTVLIFVFYSAIDGTTWCTGCAAVNCLDRCAGTANDAPTQSRPTRSYLQFVHVRVARI